MKLGPSRLDPNAGQNGASSTSSPLRRQPGRRLISASLDKTAILWQVDTGRELRTLSVHTDFVYAVALSPDGRWLVSGNFDHSVKLWGVATGREVQGWRRSTDAPSSSFEMPCGGQKAVGQMEEEEQDTNMM